MSAFGQLMEQAEAKGCTYLGFVCHLKRPAEHERRWEARTPVTDDGWYRGYGRTGEEALRKLVEALP